MPRLFQVDAFTERPFGGNPAAVCLLAQPAEAEWMQRVGAEMNLSETAFLYDAGNGVWNLRWFTPTVEVELCGHATLASAHVLWHTGAVPRDRECVFQTASGRLAASPAGDAIQLDFPASDTHEHAAPAELFGALGMSMVFCGKTQHDWLAEVPTAADVRSVRPDFDGLRRLGLRGVIVTARDESGEFDFVSRFFAPGAGIDEDPVTGSAHCALAPYWAKKLHKKTMEAWQASARGGKLQVEVAGDRVLLRGRAVLVLEGNLLV